MKSEIGGALRRELSHIRVDQELRAGILDRASASGARRRRRPRRTLTAVAAALLVLAVGGGFWSLSRPRPDNRRLTAQSPGGESGMVEKNKLMSDYGAPEGVAEQAYNLYYYVTAWTGGALCVESAFDGDGATIAYEEPDESWQVGAEDAATALEGLVDRQLASDWAQACGAGEKTGVEYVEARVTLDPASENGSIALPDGKAGTVERRLRFTDSRTPGSARELILLNGEWEGEQARLNAVACRRQWEFDGSRALTRTLWRKDAVRQQDEESCVVALEDYSDQTSPEPLQVVAPVERGGSVGIYQTKVGLADLRGGNQSIMLRITLVRFDNAGAALLLEPMDDNAITARIHALEPPAMALDARAHPGLAGWFFSEAPDPGDVIDIEDRNGSWARLTLEEVMILVEEK